jgi:hypothetical protein
MGDETAGTARPGKMLKKEISAFLVRTGRSFVPPTRQNFARSRRFPMRGASVPMLRLRPPFLQRLLEPSAIEHVDMLVGH